MRAYLSIGSNLNDRLAALQAAVSALVADPKIRQVQVSKVYETSPVGGVPQDDFYNTAVALDTTYSAHELLDKIHEIEQQLHRVRKIHWGPRTIDLDILFYGDEIIQDADLTVPHPELYNRKFVLVPLLDLYEANNPQSQKIKAALAKLSDDQAIQDIDDQITTK
ncbi:2-amino-4-hydroxy-6-hydroxymethyldihydropteridine diphosphokinase [Lactobacillaceae bacterium L1_55_11]|nr:2-amino-4-hydroxy-6-hydroxymethyldihydropteridine diphosphokinase [Lactobacillaceae bacterium L1_55_11]